MTPLFQLQNAGMHYGPTRVLHSVSLTMHAGEFITLGGPNGAGKSTLLSLLAGLTKPTEGRCLFLDRDVHLWRRRDFAQRVAVVTQAQPLAFPFTAGEVVTMGRTPHSNAFFESDADHSAVVDAMSQTGTEQFRHRDFRTLSGGEKQRVLLASALAQQPQILLLDEPATHLDLQHQVALHQLLHQLKQSGLLIVATTHDLNLAAAYADRLLLLHQGALKADGTPEEVLSPQRVREIFEVEAAIAYAANGKPWLSYGPLNG